MNKMSINLGYGLMVLKSMNSSAGFLISTSQLTSEQKARAVSEASEEPSGAERSRAHFYVLCSAAACSGMRPGKLRVRCSKCGEGAIVVHRDPCDWDDVLVAGRVTGTCSNAECDTPDVTVDFYFKVNFKKKKMHNYSSTNPAKIMLFIFRL